MDKFTQVIAKQAKRQPKYIEIKLTENQARRIISVLSDEYLEQEGIFARQHAEQNAFDKRILNKLAEQLAKS